MPSKPFYKWFPSDYLADTAHLSVTEDCLYRRLLDLHWMRGSIPLDEEEIRVFSRMTEEEFSGAWPRVRPYFRSTGKALIQKRLASELRGVSRKIAQNRNAAKARWNKGLDADAKRTQCQPLAISHKPEKDLKESTKEKPGDKSPELALEVPKSAAKKNRVNGKRPTLAEVEAYAKSRGSAVEPQKFFDYFEAGNWHDSTGKPVRSWKQKFITWDRHQPNGSSGSESHQPVPMV